MFLYVLGFELALIIVTLPEANESLVTLLSSGAILATFGSAIGSISQIWQSDLLERVKLNVDIFYKDIIKQDDPWRRWPFIVRSRTKKLLNGDLQRQTLSNPQVPLNVGTHTFEVDLPTVLEDFFDLPLIKNWWRLFWFKTSAYTVYSTKHCEEGDDEQKDKIHQQFMMYQCMLDIWWSVLKFRIARYIIHFGSGLTISGALVTVICIFLRLL